MEQSRSFIRPRYDAHVRQHELLAGMLGKHAGHARITAARASCAHPSTMENDMQMVKFAVVGAIGYLAYKAGQRSRIATEAIDDADAMATDTMEMSEDDGDSLHPHGDHLASATGSSANRKSARTTTKSRSKVDNM